MSKTRRRKQTASPNMSAQDIKRLQIKIIDALIQFQLEVHQLKAWETRDQAGATTGYLVGNDVGSDTGACVRGHGSPLPLPALNTRE